nr:calphotin-like [Setaria viridis]
MKRGLCGSSRNIQRRVGPRLALGTGLTGTRVEAASADPDTAVLDTAAGADATTPDAAGLVDNPGTCVAVSVEVAPAVDDADARPALSPTATVSVAAAGAGVPVPTASTASIAAAGARVPAPVAAARAGVPAAAVAFAAAAGAGVPASTATVVPVAATRVDFPSSDSAAVYVVVAGATAPIPAAAISAVAIGAAGSSALSSRSITSPVGGTPEATPCPAGSAAGVEGRVGVGPCLVPGYDTIPPVAAVGAASAVGSAVSPATLPLAAGGVAVRPAEVDDTRSAFFGAKSGTKSRGAAL